MIANILYIQYDVVTAGVSLSFCGVYEVQILVYYSALRDDIDRPLSKC